MKSFFSFRPINIVIGLMVSLGIVVGLAWVSTGFAGFWGWSSFAIVILFAWVFFLLGWWIAKIDSPPNKIFSLVLIAAVLRLVLGVFWFTALPVWGYEDSPVNQAGYVMLDSYERDGAAWELAQSGGSLLGPFFGNSGTDQYGGVLALSAFVYRYFGTDSHQPLLIIVLTAAFSSLTVLFAWLITNRLIGSSAANISAWAVVFYPEAIFQSSSQTREAFLMSLAVLFIWQLLLFVQTKKKQNFFWLMFTLAISFLISYPFAGLMFAIGVLFPYWLLESAEEKRRQLRLIWVILGIGILAVTLFVKPLSYWVIHVLGEQKKTLLVESGMVAYLFDFIPTWLHLPFVTTYGILRPLLPPAVFNHGAPIWRGIAIFRALGWTVVLPLQIYAAYLSFSREIKTNGLRFLVWVNWFMILFAAVRGYGDQWDNPRYRVAFAGIQLLLAVWAVQRQQETRDPWLRRFLISMGLMVFMFMPYYFERKFFEIGWPIESFVGSVTSSTILVMIYLGWDIWKTRKGIH